LIALLLESRTYYVKINILEVVILCQNKKIHIILDVLKHDTNALESSLLHDKEEEHHKPHLLVP